MSSYPVPYAERSSRSGCRQPESQARCWPRPQMSWELQELCRGCYALFWGLHRRELSSKAQVLVKSSL